MAEETNVAELAGDNVKERGIFTLPISAVMAVVLIASIVASVSPMGYIFMSTSEDSLNNLAVTTVNLAVNQAVTGTSQILTSTTGTLNGLLASPYFTNDFMTNAGNTSGSATLYPALFQALNTNNYFSTVICQNVGGGENVSNGMGGVYYNHTNIQAMYYALKPGQPAAPLVVVQDLATQPMVYAYVLLPDFHTVIAKVPFGPATGVQAADVQHWAQVSANPPVNGFFGATFVVIPQANISFWQVSYYRNKWVNAAVAGKTAPDYGCQVGFKIEESLTRFFNSITVTQNTVIMLLDDQNLLISTNMPNSIAFGNATMATRVSPDASPNAVVANIGSGLLSLFGKYSNLPKLPLNSTVVYTTKLNDGDQWYLASTQITVENSPFSFVVAIPRSDIFGNIDAARRYGIIVAATVSCAVVIVAVVIIILALLPLHRMAVAMIALTRFDFSVLEGGSMDRRSFFTEIAKVETVFDTMVKAFASSIKKNRSLAMGTSSSGTQGISKSVA